MAAKKTTAKKTTAKKTAAKSAAPKLTAAQKRKILASYSPTKVGTKLKSTGQSPAARKADRRLDAKAPGKRVTSTGSVYYERRANRAD
jgi:DNA-binding protein HU-beta